MLCLESGFPLPQPLIFITKKVLNKANQKVYIKIGRQIIPAIFEESELVLILFENI